MNLIGNCLPSGDQVDRLLGLSFSRLRA